MILLLIKAKTQVKREFVCDTPLGTEVNDRLSTFFLGALLRSKPEWK
jgi:hypothetical protein